MNKKVVVAVIFAVIAILILFGIIVSYRNKGKNSYDGYEQESTAGDIVMSKDLCEITNRELLDNLTQDQLTAFNSTIKKDYSDAYGVFTIKEILSNGDIKAEANGINILFINCNTFYELSFE